MSPITRAIRRETEVPGNSVVEHKVGDLCQYKGWGEREMDVNQAIASPGGCESFCRGAAQSTEAKVNRVGRGKGLEDEVCSDLLHL